MVTVLDMSTTLAIRTVSAALWRSGKYFDERCYFTRALMAFERKFFTFEAGAQLRKLVMGPQEMLKLRPTDADLAQEAPTQDSQSEEMAAPVGAEWLADLWGTPRTQRRPIAEAAGFTQRRQESAQQVVPGLWGPASSSRTQRGNAAQMQHPNSSNAKTAREKRSPAKVALDQITHERESLAYNFGRDEGNWCNGRVTQVKDGDIAIQFDGEDGVMHFTPDELMQTYDAKKQWRVGAMANELNSLMTPLAVCASASFFAAAVALRLAEEAEDRATVWKKGDLCEVPCQHYEGKLQLAIFDSADQDGIKVKLCINNNLTIVKPEEMKLTRKSKRQLSALGAERYQVPLPRGKLAKDEVWRCDESKCNSSRRRIKASLSQGNIAEEELDELKVRYCAE
jgi:hypothetical protein